MKESIFKHVIANSGTSFSGMVEAVDGARGDQMFFYAGYQNLVLWPALSRTAIDALTTLLREGTIDIRPVATVARVTGDAAAGLPVARRVKSYREVRWLPATLHVPPRACGICGKTGGILNVRKSWDQARRADQVPQSAWACVTCNRREQSHLRSGRVTLAELWGVGNHHQPSGQRTELPQERRNEF